MTNTLYSLSILCVCASSVKRLISSTELFEAASNSIGVPAPLFIIFAKIRAEVVLPVPAPPQNKYPCLIVLVSI